MAKRVKEVVVEQDVEETEAAETEAEAAGEGLIEVIASSLSVPGHRRGGHFWPAGQLAKAMLTPAQAAQVRADRRITIFDPDGKIPTTNEIQDTLEKSIRAEMDRAAEERRRMEAVDNMRRRTEPVAGMRDFQDKRR